MKLFRLHCMAKAFSLITGIVFLNMSFFLAEVSLLKITNPELIENIAKLVTSSGFEEERDGESEKHDTSAKEINLLTHQQQLHHESLFLTAVKMHCDPDSHYPHANYSQTFSPPPDSALIS